MSFTEEDYKYMARALQLASNGRGQVSPNPMVGAVVVCGRRIIGEGWHRRFGGPHAEVNAMNSIAEADRSLIPASTMYVTLEPCAHYGKTPPCAVMLAEKGIGRVVVACLDPNPKVSGKGIGILKNAGIDAAVGLMEKEAVGLNKAFMTAHKEKRPFITLKWAQSADGFIDSDRTPDAQAAKFSNAIGSMYVHWRRANHDAIAVGASTATLDNPRLTVRAFEGRDPRPVVFDRHGLVRTDNCTLLENQLTVHLTGSAAGNLLSDLRSLYADYGITSLLVEGGAGLLNSFISEALWDEAYVETSTLQLGARGRVKAPVISMIPDKLECLAENRLITYINRH